MSDNIENPFEAQSIESPAVQPAEELALTKEQTQQLMDIWNLTPEPPALKDITRALFGKECDGRSKEGRAVKTALVKLNLQARPAQQYVAKVTTLTDEQKAYVDNNASNMSSLEMARILFNNKKLSNLHAEVRAVSEYAKTLNSKVLFADPDDVPGGKYEAPKTLDKALRKVNQYIHTAWVKESLSSRQKKQLDSLIGYLNTYALTHQLNVYTSQDDRRLFEDSFVRFTHDKSDLTQEEVNQYIVLCNEVVLASRVQARLEQLKDLLDTAVDNNNPAQVLSINETISETNDEHNECVKRQQNLYHSLTQKRSERVAKSIRETATILHLVQNWKAEESRKQLIAIADQDKKDINETIGKLRDMDDVRARILGLTVEEALYG